MSPRSRHVAALAVAITALGLQSAAADDTPVSVERSQFGWISTEVTDLGSPETAPPRNERKPARRCAQHMSDSAGGYASQEQFGSGAPAGAGPGGWVIRECSDGSVDTAWVPAQADAVTLQRLAQRAVNRLLLPVPQPTFEPRRHSSAGPATLVAVPTSFFMDGWAPISQRTQVGAVWAVVTAEPVAATWWPGDGSSPVRCASAGRAWTATESAGTPCTHTYRRSSAAQPNNVYTARVVVTWQVRWRGSGGLTGTLPLMERQTDFPVAVAERQTVIVVGGGDR